MLGRWFGEPAIAFVQRRLGVAPRTLSAVERWFRRLAGPAVFLFPGALVCTLAGHVGMSWRRFLTLNLTGSVAAVLVLRVVAGTASGWITALLAWNDDNAGWLTLVTVGVTAVWLLSQRRRGGLLSVRTFGRELGDEGGTSQGPPR